MLEIFALSLSSEIEKYGAYAGFATIPGLAVLALLYFAQAREVRRLREWAGRAPERAQELQDRVIAQAERAAQRPPAAAPERRVVAQPKQAATPAAQRTQPPGTPAPAGAPGAGPPGAPGAPPKPGEPARPGGPAPAGAPGAPAPGGPGRPGEPSRPGAPAPSAPSRPGEPTRPGAPAPSAPSRPGEPSRPGAPVPAAAPSSPGEGRPGEPSRPAAPARPPEAAPVPAAATAAGERAAGAPGRAAASTASPPRPAERTEVRRPAPAAPLRRSAPSATMPPRAPDRRGGGPPEGPGRRRPIMIGAGVVAGLVLAVLVATQLLGGDDTATDQPNTVGPPQTAGRTAGAATPVARGDVTVAVLNGTTVPGLAAQVGDQLQSAGFARGQVTNAADQQRSETVVQYAPEHRAAAGEVAQILRVPRGRVRALDANTQAIAGPDSEVVVTVGADRTQ